MNNLEIGRKIAELYRQVELLSGEIADNSKEKVTISRNDRGGATVVVSEIDIHSAHQIKDSIIRRLSYEIDSRNKERAERREKLLSEIGSIIKQQT